MRTRSRASRATPHCILLTAYCLLAKPPVLHVPPQVVPGIVLVPLDILARAVDVEAVVEEDVRAQLDDALDRPLVRRLALGLVRRRPGLLQRLVHHVVL